MYGCGIEDIETQGGGTVPSIHHPSCMTRVSWPIEASHNIYNNNVFGGISGIRYSKIRVSL